MNHEDLYCPNDQVHSVLYGFSGTKYLQKAHAQNEFGYLDRTKQICSIDIQDMVYY